MRILLLLFAFISSTFVQAQNIHIGAQSGMKNYNYEITKIGYYPVYRTNWVDTVCSHTYSDSYYEPIPRKCLKCGETAAIRMPGTYSLPNTFLPIWPTTDTATYWPVTDSVLRLPYFDTTNAIRFYKITDSIPLAPKEPTTWINIDSNRLIAQAFDTNHKETGYISYYKQSDRYTTRGSVKQAVKALYAFTLREIDFASVYMLFIDAINEDGTIKDQALYYRAVQQMRIIKQRYGL